MKKFTTLTFIFLGLVCQAQSVIQTVNSGSVIASKSSVSIGEIVVNAQNQSNSGLIGILAQINAQTLEVSQYELADNMIVYPNPTVSKVFFQTDRNLKNKSVSVYNNTGQLVVEKQINSDNSLDLNELASGIYLIQFSDKNIKSFKIIKH